MTPATTVDESRWVEVLHHLGVQAGTPLPVGGGLRASMAPTANGGGDFNTRPDGDIVGIGGMVSGGPMAVLALNRGQERGGGLADEPGGLAVAECVAGQAGRVFILVRVQQHLERLRVGGELVIRMHGAVALDTDLSAGVLGGGTKGFEKGIGAGERNGGSAGEVGARPDRLPGAIQSRFLKQLVIAGRPVPSEGDGVAVLQDARHDRAAGHAAGLRNAEVLHALGQGGGLGREQNGSGQKRRESWIYPSSLGAVHTL